MVLIPDWFSVHSISISVRLLSRLTDIAGQILYSNARHQRLHRSIPRRGTTLQV